MRWTNSEGVRVHLRNPRSASPPEAFPCCASLLMSASLVRRNYGPQLYELMAAARKRPKSDSFAGVIFVSQALHPYRLNLVRNSLSRLAQSA